MTMIKELAQVIITTFGYTFLTPFYWVVVFIVFIQHRRQADLEKKLFGRPISRIWPQLYSSIGLGALGGFLAGLTMILLGLSLEQMGLVYVWPVAILLLFVNPRYLCFSYAGGIVALFSMAIKFLSLYFPFLTGSPLTEGLLKIHVPALLALIALLHLMESLLIYLGGHWNPSPVYFKGIGDRVVGGFALQRFWPLPLVALMVSVILSSEISGVSMPEWWPIIKAPFELGPGQTLQYMAVPVVAGLGYADLAISVSPKEKSAASARCLAIYSLLLLVAAVAAEFRPWFTLPGILLAPLGHEWLIVHGQRKEHSRPPLYSPPPRGAGVMMVIPGSPADRAGLKSGDIILRVNGEELLSGMELFPLIQRGYFMTLLEVDRGGRAVSVILKRSLAGKTGTDPLPAPAAPEYLSRLYRKAELGIIVAPPPDCPVYVEIKTPTFLSPLRRLRSWWGKR